MADLDRSPAPPPGARRGQAPVSGRARRRRKARAISNARSTSEIPLILVGGLAAGRRPGHAPRRGRGSAVRASGTDLTRKARSLQLQRFAPQLCRMPARRARRLRAHPSRRCGQYGLGLRDAEPAIRHGRKAARRSSRAMARRPTLPPLRAGMLRKAGRSRRVRPCRSPGPGDPTRQPVRPRAGQRAPHRGRRLRTASGPVPGPAGQRAGCGARAEIDKRRAKPAAGRCGGGRRAQAPFRTPLWVPSTIRANPSPGARAMQSSANWSTPSATRRRSGACGQGAGRQSLASAISMRRCADAKRCADRRAPCCRPAGPRGRACSKLQSRRSR